MRTRKHGSRFLIMFAIACGSLAAGLFYKNQHLPLAQTTDAQSQKLGYASQADEAKSDRDFAYYYPDIGATGRLSAQEYELASETFNHGSRQAKAHMIAALGFIRGEAERRKVLGLMPRGEIEPALLGLWRSSFYRWMKGPKDQSVLQLLSDSGNANAIKWSATEKLDQLKD